MQHKKCQVKKRTNREYNVQHNRDIEYQYMEMYYATKQFTELQFLGPHRKPHGVCVFGKHDHMRFDPKLGNVTCAIRQIPCACNRCTSIIY